MKKIFLFSLLFLVVFIIIDRGIGKVINIGLSKYFGLRQHSEILFIGHSQLMLAIDKNRIEDSLNCNVSKYCREGADVVDRYQMIKQYLSSSYSDSLKIVIYGIDQFIFKNSGLSMNSYMNFYPFIDEPDINEYIKTIASPVDYWEHKLICSTRYSDALLNSSIRGWSNNWENLKVGILDTLVLKEQIINKQQRTIEFDPIMIKIFEESITFLTKRKIHVILVQTPVAEILNSYEPEKYKRIQEYFIDFSRSSLYINYWDLNTGISDKYDCFFDPIHLNPKGQSFATNRLISHLKLFYE